MPKRRQNRWKKTNPAPTGRDFNLQNFLLKDAVKRAHIDGASEGTNNEDGMGKILGSVREACDQEGMVGSADSLRNVAAGKGDELIDDEGQRVSEKHTELSNYEEPGRGEVRWGVEPDDDEYETCMVTTAEPGHDGGVIDHEDICDDIVLLEGEVEFGGVNGQDLGCIAEDGDLDF